MLIADFANSQPPSSKLGLLKDYFLEEDIPAPIDMYRSSVADILSLGTTETLSTNMCLGRLLALGIVSAAEGYVRFVLSSCIEMCPIAQFNAAKKEINLGGLLWHGRVRFSRSAFEHASFASRDELVKTIQQFVGFRLEDGVFKSILDEYNSICNIRHGIVHSDGVLPGRNAVQLDIPRFSKPARTVIRYAQLQEIAAVINTLVFTLNRELFSEFCKRWAVDWRKRADWQDTEATKLFNRIWDTFHSSTERKLRKQKSNITRSACMTEVKRTYGLL